MPDDELTKVQEYFTDLYELYRLFTGSRNPSDAKFAKWCGVGTGSMNHWLNAVRTPELPSIVKITTTLRKKRFLTKKKVQQVWPDSDFDYMNLFDIMGYPRIYVVDSPMLELILEYYDELPNDLKEEIDTELKRLSGRSPKDDNNTEKESKKPDGR